MIMTFKLQEYNFTKALTEINGVMIDDRLSEIKSLRALKFYNNFIRVRRIKAPLFYRFARRSHAERYPREHQLFEHLESFNIYKNYRQLIETASMVKYKKERTEMKFETWDSKYQVTFARRTNINDFQDILKEYLIEYFALDEENTSFILKPFRMYEIWFRWFQPTRIFCATGYFADCN